MADNYLEKRYEEVFGQRGASSYAVSHPSLETLLRRNCSLGGFDKSYKVHPRQLEAIIRVNTMIGSSVNVQSLRFRSVFLEDEASKVNSLIGMGGSLPERRIPSPGTESESFIIVCGTIPESASICMDLGISLQSMLLKAEELGLGGLIVRNFNPGALKEALLLPLEPLAVLAVGKSVQRIDSLQCVPEIRVEDLMI